MKVRYSSHYPFDEITEADVVELAHMTTEESIKMSQKTPEDGAWLGDGNDPWLNWKPGDEEPPF